MTRRDTIIQLIRWLPEATDNTGGRIGNWIHGGPDSKLITYGPLWHDSCPKGCDGTRPCNSPFPELVRCLTQLRHEHELWYDHLTWRYWGGHTSRRGVRYTKTTHGPGQPTGLRPNQEIHRQGGATTSRYTIDCAIYAWPPWVRQPEVDKAIDYLTNTYQGQPHLPRALAA